MTDKSARPQFCRDATWYPVNYGWQPSLIYNQHFGLPPILDSRDLSWMESVLRKLGSSSWSGYTRTSMLVSCGQTPSLKIHREMGGGLSEVWEEVDKWRVSLDVNHFAPTELTVRTKDGFLEIGGEHKERQDEHGYISRSFLRKYKLPVGLEAETVKSVLTGDGILIVEASLPSIPPTADVTIPVQVEVEVAVVEGEQDAPQPGEGAEGADLPSAETETADALVHPVPGEKPEAETVPQQTDSDDRLHLTEDVPEYLPAPTSVEGEQAAGAESQVEEDQPDVQREVMEQQQEKETAEEGPEEAATGEGEAVEECQEPEEHSQAPQTPDTVTSEQEEGSLPVDGEIQQEGEVEMEVRRTEDESEHHGAGQFQEEVPSQLKVQEKLEAEQLEKMK